MRQAYTHQEQALEFADGRISLGLFMEMRLGKSLVAIRWALRGYPKGTHLIVAPLSTLPGWEDELELEGQMCTSLRDPSKYAHEGNQFHLVNYEWIRSRPELLEWDYDTIILDESTRIKNPRAQITKVLTQGTDHIPQHCILSGLPAPEGPLDYFTQMAFMGGSFMGSRNYWAWRHRYFVLAGFDWLPRRGTRAAIKRAIESECFRLTRKQAGVGSDKVRERRVVSMTPPQQRAYEEVERSFALGPLQTKFEVVRVNWMARIAGGVHPETKKMTWPGKAKELMELLRGELKEEQVVVWFRYNAELHHIRARLRKDRIPFSWITGATRLKNRAIRIRRFRAGKFRVFLIQMKCGKYGLDLASADTAIYYSNSYSGEDRQQSEDRIISVRKRLPVLYLDLITLDTVDEEAVDALMSKRSQARLLMGDLLKKLRQRFGKGGRDGKREAKKKV